MIGTTAAENLRVMESIYAEMAKGDMQSLLDRMADDVCWTVVGDTKLSGTVHGKAAAIEKLTELLKPFQEVATLPENFIADDGHVAIQATARFVASDEEITEIRYCVIHRLVDGMIREVTEYPDTKKTQEMLGD